MKKFIPNCHFLRVTIGLDQNAETGSENQDVKWNFLIDMWIGQGWEAIQSNPITFSIDHFSRSRQFLGHLVLLQEKSNLTRNIFFFFVKFYFLVTISSVAEVDSFAKWFLVRQNRLVIGALRVNWAIPLGIRMNWLWSLLPTVGVRLLSIHGNFSVVNLTPKEFLWTTHLVYATATIRCITQNKHFTIVIDALC